MHELPRELARSLRSWRGSVVRDSLDIEKAGAEFLAQEFSDRDLHGTSSSLILHPTKSTQGLNRAEGGGVQRGQCDGHHDGPAANLPSAQQPQQQKQQRPEAEADQEDGTVAAPTSIERPRVTPPRKQVIIDVETPVSNKKSVFDMPPVKDPDNAADRLDDDLTPLTPDAFYELMGMQAPPGKNVNPRRFAVPNGLFARIGASYDHVSRQYRSFDVLTYALMTVQLLLSAVFIVLGSLSSLDSHVAIAVLGAVSTVIAGSLALMKGQGLPNRLRQGRDGLRNVIFEAEELYWDAGAGRPVRYADVKKVREDYLRVMEEQHRNHPDTWNAVSAGISGGIRPAVPARSQGVPAQSLPAPGA